MTVPDPDDQCATATDPQLCYTQYLAQREYERVTDPAQSALTEAFPVLCVVFAAYLAVKIAGL